MGNVGGHDDELMGFGDLGFAADDEFDFAVQDVYHSVEGRGMFGEFLSLIKSEEGDGAVGLLDQSLADDGFGIVLDVCLEVHVLGK